MEFLRLIWSFYVNFQRLLVLLRYAVNQRQKTLNTLLMGAVIVQLMSCSSTTRFDTAKPLGAKQAQAFASFVGGNLDSSAVGQSTMGEQYFGELGFRFGLTDNFQVGLKYSLPYGGGLESKYAWLGQPQESKFSIANGFNLQFTNFELGDIKGKNLDFGFPVYLTFQPWSWVSLTVAPEYIGRYEIERNFTFDTVDLDPRRKMQFQDLWGGTSNLRLGTAETSLMGEFGWRYNAQLQRQEVHYGFAIVESKNPLDLLRSLFGQVLGGIL